MMFKELRHITNFPDNPAGRVCRKEQGDNNATKRLLYSYNPHDAPHAARRIYDPTTTNLRQMLWDANGNIVQIAEYLYDATNEIVNLQDFRNHYWDEDDRLDLVLDNSHFSYYLYGNDGQRVAKLTGSAFTLGTGFATNAMLDNYTLYPSEYLVVTQQGYTKYYYANGTRIASKLGSGGFEKMTRLCTLDLNITANANMLFNSVVARIGEDVLQEFISDPCPAYNSDMAGFRVPLQPLNFEANFGITAQQNILQAFRQNYANEETYFFHGNHLGSANWVTLQNASPTQFLLHLPYGEEFVKQLNSTYDERFTFTGKEKDIETGYYYFGARFDNVDLGFMSVDPMAEKYPSMSPYNYCAWNPIKLVDPEGREINPIFSTEGKLLGSDASGYKGIPIVMDKNDYSENMSLEEAISKGKFLDKYGKGIRISDDDWEKVVNEGGERREPTVSNESDYTIYYKPEGIKDGVNMNPGYSASGAYPIAPHTDLYASADGVAAPHIQKNAVFKMPDKLNIIVTNQSINRQNSSSKLSWCASFVPFFGGWNGSLWHEYLKAECITIPTVSFSVNVSKQVDHSWDNLFKKSR